MQLNSPCFSSSFSTPTRAKTGAARVRAGAGDCSAPRRDETLRPPEPAAGGGQGRHCGHDGNAGGHVARELLVQFKRSWWEGSSILTNRTISPTEIFRSNSSPPRLYRSAVFTRSVNFHNCGKGRACVCVSAYLAVRGCV